MRSTFARFPELWITALMLALIGAIGWSLGLPISLPAGKTAAFVGIHYLYPLFGVGIWALIAFVGLRHKLASTFLVALPCYAIVMICHFNLKLWRPLINPTNWDGLYWQSDQALRPLIALCITIREALFPIIPADSNLYMTAFIAMFYFSFCYHALFRPDSFRPLFLAALIFQGVGALAYLVMPALGPFLYEQGVETLQSGAQAGMLATYRQIAGGGAEWIAANGGAHLTAGLGAMPSLHSGGAFLFLLFSWRYARALTPTYLALFGFIAIDAVANRWHYVIDIPVGVALAWGSAWAAERLHARAPQTKPSELREAQLSPI